jgi:hypothetical protein
VSPPRAPKGGIEAGTDTHTPGRLRLGRAVRVTIVARVRAEARAKAKVRVRVRVRIRIGVRAGAKARVGVRVGLLSRNKTRFFGETSSVWVVE